MRVGIVVYVCEGVLLNFMKLRLVEAQVGFCVKEFVVCLS